MSRVENMFGPRASWGKGDEMAVVRERAVRQEGGRAGEKRIATPPAGARNDKAGGGKGASSVGKGAAPDRRAKGSLGKGAREAKKAGFRRGNAPWGGLAGFVSIRCGGCGKVTNTCLHERRPVFECRQCGHGTSLERVANIHMKCQRCGFTGKYRTNRVEEEIVMECLNCSEIVPMKKVRRGNYVPEVEA